MNFNYDHTGMNLNYIDKNMNLHKYSQSVYYIPI